MQQKIIPPLSLIHICSSRCATCLEYIGTGIVAQPIDYRLVSSNKTTEDVDLIMGTFSKSPSMENTPSTTISLSLIHIYPFVHQEIDTSVDE